MYSLEYRPEMDHTQYLDNGGGASAATTPIFSYLSCFISGLYCRRRILAYQYLPTGSVDGGFVDIDGGLWAHALAIINQQGKKCLWLQWQWQFADFIKPCFPPQPQTKFTPLKNEHLYRRGQVDFKNAIPMLHGKHKNVLLTEHSKHIFDFRNTSAAKRPLFFGILSAKGSQK